MGLQVWYLVFWNAFSKFVDISSCSFSYFGYALLRKVISIFPATIEVKFRKCVAL